ncbi:MAG: hypothetical protein IPH55_17230 [Betaproteobacteria bacterium]|nr:hypothetical protein [Betaproteobacteria bacterium]
MSLARGSSLLRHSHVVVCHGGSGTIYQAIAAGVPVIGIATFHDQEINLERVEAMHWGVALDPMGWRESDLLAAIERSAITGISRGGRGGSAGDPGFCARGATTAAAPCSEQNSGCAA